MVIVIITIIIVTIILILLLWNIGLNHCRYTDRDFTYIEINHEKTWNYKHMNILFIKSYIKKKYL